MTLVGEWDLEDPVAGAAILAEVPSRRPEDDRRLRAAALCLQGMLDDPVGLKPRWRTRGFVRCVEMVRASLGPIRSRQALADSYGREALRHDPLETAYALRWLELTTRLRRPPWSALTERS